MNIDVIFKGLEMAVEGEVITEIKGGHEEQHEPESFEIGKVFYKNVDIWDLIIAFNGEEELTNLVKEKL